MGMMIVFAFFSMFRATMMRPVREKPIDSTRDLVLAKKQPPSGLNTCKHLKMSGKEKLVQKVSVPRIWTILTTSSKL